VVVMKDGTASDTARSVAAHRLEFERVAADYGDPAADQSLTVDVADGREATPGRMHEYLRARTAFFDRVVVSALDRGVRQVVIGGAGYDGRALRYAKPGVRWFEVDHPATQSDKVERVARLNGATGHLRFIPADFTADPIAEPLLAAGLDPARPTLFLLEGVAVYLERPVLVRVLAAFRQVAADGSELAMSVSTGTATPQERARFEQRVAALGEPARSTLTHGQARDLLAADGWELSEGPGRQLSAGLLLARAAAPQLRSSGARSPRP
jgi:methyltransferase (TIGR00027 family)